jgi:hypothetical protein
MRELRGDPAPASRESRRDHSVLAETSKENGL